MRKFLLPFLIFTSLFLKSQVQNLVKDIYPGVKSAFFDAPYGISHSLNPINTGETINVDANSLSNGIYLYSLQVSGVVIETKKLTIVK